MYQACNIYIGIFSCGENYIGETVRNVEVSWNEHNNQFKRQISEVYPNSLKISLITFFIG